MGSKITHIEDCIDVSIRMLSRKYPKNGISKKLNFFSIPIANIGEH